ncbi:hypothetical protein HHI36_012050 [Cryptolaemus montrouzieri]|uniref:ATP-dependent RNA helicase n=1 Tax=Cryptolaemus montrouzieri TaxID=559131 RepID=A0ABD2NDZ9_9CUCU
MSKVKKNPKKVKVFTKNKKVNKPEKEFISQLQAKYEEKVDSTNIKSFANFPLSPKTLKGLKTSGYNKPTDIQRETLMLGITGKDILGAAQTGSGKTLAFIIPILERLFCKQWTHLDGLGALVITPTRELAYQIFETLRRVGSFHDFSAGLIIGGKDLKFERRRMDQCNIIICTPGRLLQHMDENPLFNADNLQILVLDEADRCLDMGFEETMNAIIANLPVKRQTLLFSATQTKSVKDLARLSLKDPSYVAVHENAKYSTPSGLQQSYVVCELKDKLSILWSFIKNHLKQKSIIFLSSCKQVKYIFEIFSKLRPGISLMALYGTLHQLRRMEIYKSFARKSSAVLFATDLAARGLDFPEVHWVVQVDCPEDSATYIHRVGRTARFHKGGESLLLLLPSELNMLEELESRKIPINKIDINPTKLNDPVRKIQASLVNLSLKESAKRAFMSYVKSVYLMKNKKIFDVEALDTDSFAYSLGLTNPPRIRFLQRMISKRNNNNAISRTINSTNPNKKYFDDDDGDESDNLDGQNMVPEKLEQNDASNESDHEYDGEIDKFNELGVDDQSDNDFFDILENEDSKKTFNQQVKKDLILEEIDFSRSFSRKPTTKAAIVRKMLKQTTKAGKNKIIFDDTGEAVIEDIQALKSELAQESENEDIGGINVEKSKLLLQDEDKFDKQLFKERVKAKHKEQKRKLKEQKMKEKQDVDEFGEESDEEPDLSWLPDPDKVYGDKEGTENQTRKSPIKKK